MEEQITSKYDSYLIDSPTSEEELDKALKERGYIKFVNYKDYQKCYERFKSFYNAWKPEVDPLTLELKAEIINKLVGENMIFPYCRVSSFMWNKILNKYYKNWTTSEMILDIDIRSYEKIDK